MYIIIVLIDNLKKDMMESSKMIKKMVKVYLHRVTSLFLKENFSMMSDKGKEYLNFLMGEGIRANF